MNANGDQKATKTMSRSPWTQQKTRQTQMGSFLMSQTLEERSLAFKLQDAKNSSRPVTDMSALPKLKPSRKLQQYKKKLQEDGKMN